jgi:hypothetical protein
MRSRRDPLASAPMRLRPIRRRGEAFDRQAKAHRSFDPRRVGALECDAWVAYYRHEWVSFLWSAVALTRHTFGLPWLGTLHGAWLALRANQLWARVPDNDADGAQRAMERFYRLVVRYHHERFDPARAAQLEVDWWRAHRDHQRLDQPAQGPELTDALAALYAYVYGVSAPDVRVAARQRALAMDYSDRWVPQGCDLTDALIAEERAALIRSYAALLAAVHRV